MGSNPIEASEFFLGFIYNCLSYFLTAWITFTCSAVHVKSRSVVEYYVSKDFVLLLQVPGFLGCIRQAAKQQVSDETDAGDGSIKVCEDSESTSRFNTLATDNEVLQTPLVKYPLWYVGKVVVSHRQAPPTLIDDSVERFKNLRRALDSERDSKVQERKDFMERSISLSKNHIKQQPPTTEPKGIHKIASKTQSLESGVIHGESGGTRPAPESPRAATNARPRSASDGDKNKPCSSLKEGGRPNLMLKTHTRTASFGNEAENRNVLLQITGHTVTIIGMVSKVVLMEKRLRDISFCQQVCFYLTLLVYVIHCVPVLLLQSFVYPFGLDIYMY